MSIEKAFKLDIDFDVLESIAYRWGMEDQNLAKSGGLENQTLQKIQLYAGAGKKPYVLLFSFSVPETRGLWGQCVNGLKYWQDGRQYLKKACKSDKAQTMENWRIFAHDESENQYLTIEYLLRNEKKTVYFDKDPEDMFDDASNLLPGLSKDDFIDDSWILTESGFKKHVLDDAPRILFESKKRLDAPHKDSPVSAEPDKDRWSFILNGPVWDVTFDGETGHVKDCTPVRRMMAALERPGTKFSYILLSQIAGGTDAEQDGLIRHKAILTENDLSFHDNDGNRATKQDIDTMEAALHVQYKEYLQHQEAERDRWLKLKKIATTDYQLHVIETDDGLKVKRSKWRTDSDSQLEKARKAISKNRKDFLDNIKRLQGLHEHMKKCLEIKNGIVYSPPEGSPSWQIR